MKFRFNPAGASSHEWEFDPDKLLTLVEAGEIERRCPGMTFDEAKVAVLKGSATAKHAFLYVLLKREIPTLKWDTLQPMAGEVTVDYDLAEMVEIRAELVKQLDAGGSNEADLRAGLEILDKEIAELGGEPEPEPEQPEDPKDAPAPSSVSSGGLHSLPSSTSLPVSSTA